MISNMVEMLEQILLKSYYPLYPIFKDQVSFFGYSAAIKLPFEHAILMQKSLTGFLNVHDLQKYFTANIIHNNQNDIKVVLSLKKRICCKS